MRALRFLAIAALALLSASNGDPRATVRAARHTGRTVRGRTDGHYTALIWHEAELVSVSPNSAGQVLDSHSSPSAGAAILPATQSGLPRLRTLETVQVFASAILPPAHRHRTDAPRGPPQLLS